MPGGAKALGKVPQKKYRHSRVVRVKRRGKSSPGVQQWISQGKPHQMQDQVDMPHKLQVSFTPEHEGRSQD
jgi:hypothetical protein